MGRLFVETVASALGDVVDLIRILHRLNQGFETTGQPSVLFLDEAHRLAPGNTPRGSSPRSGNSPRGLDEEALFPLLEPYLRQLSFVQTLSRRVITEKGLQYLARVDAVHPQPPGDRP